MLRPRNSRRSTVLQRKRTASNDLPHKNSPVSKKKKTLLQVITTSSESSENVVIQNVLRVIGQDFKTLRNIRLVCKAWFHESLHLWRSTAVLILDDVDVTFVDNWNVTTNVQLQSISNLSLPSRLNPELFQKYADEYHSSTKFLQLVRFPHTSYKLWRWKWNAKKRRGQNQDDDQRIRSSFWEKVGMSMTFVHFQQCVIDMSEMDWFASVIFKNIPNLQNLVLTDNKFIGGTQRKVKGPVNIGHTTSRRHSQIEPPPPVLKPEVDLKSTMISNGAHVNLKSLDIKGSLPVEWKDFLQKLPNLESIRSRNDTNVNLEGTNRLAKALCELRQECQFQKANLKHLDFMFTGAIKMVPGDIDNLINCRLPLESLAFEVDNTRKYRGISDPPISGKEATSRCEQLLEAYTDSLEILQIYRESNRKVLKQPLDNFSFGTISLEILTELHLWGHVTDSFIFLRNVPNIRVLCMNFECVEDYKGLSRFEYFDDSRWLSRSDLGHTMVQKTKDQLKQMNLSGLDLVLRNLRKFRIDLEVSSKDIRTLAGWMPNVRILETVLTSKNYPAVFLKWPFLEQLVILPSTNPEITDMEIGYIAGLQQNLGKFEMVTICGRERIGTWAAYNGFAKMENLTSLKISVTSGFSEDAESFLKLKIPEVEIIRSYCECMVCYMNLQNGGRLSECRCLHEYCRRNCGSTTLSQISV